MGFFLLPFPLYVWCMVFLTDILDIILQYRCKYLSFLYSADEDGFIENTDIQHFKDSPQEYFPKELFSLGQHCVHCQCLVPMQPKLKMGDRCVNTFFSDT